MAGCRLESWRWGRLEALSQKYAPVADSAIQPMSDLRLAWNGCIMKACVIMKMANMTTFLISHAWSDRVISTVGGCWRFYICSFLAILPLFVLFLDILHLFERHSCRKKLKCVMPAVWRLIQPEAYSMCGRRRSGGGGEVSERAEERREKAGKPLGRHGGAFSAWSIWRRCWCCSFWRWCSAYILVLLFWVPGNYICSVHFCWVVPVQLAVLWL